MRIEQQKTYLRFTNEDGLNFTYEFVAANILHCVVTASEKNGEESDYFASHVSEIIEPQTMLPFPDVDKETEKYSGRGLSFQTEAMKVRVDGTTGALTVWEAGSDEVLLQEGVKTFMKTPVYTYTTGGEAPIVDRVRTVDGERNFIKNLKQVLDHESYRAKIAYEFAKEEAIYGLGQGEEGVLNHRGQNDYLYQHNMRIPMPMFYSSKGYGILYDCGSLMTFEDDANGSYIFMDCVPAMDYYVVVGPSADTVISGFRKLTGQASLLPRWAFGYIQSKEQYYSAKELRDVVKKYRDLNIPIDGVVQDWNSWAPGQWGEKRLDPERYADMEEMSKEIREMNAHTMISVWPNMNSTTADYAELFDAGYILNDLSTYNVFIPEARKMYWQQAKKGLFDRGFESFWCDSTEPFSGPDWNGEVKREPWERYQLVGSEHKKYLPPEKANLYALAHAKGIYENQKADTKEIRVLNLTRSGYASGQKYNALLWSGDIKATWETLKNQIAEGLNMGLSGYPYWTLDIGAFFTRNKNWTKRGCGCNTDDTPKWFWTGDYENGGKDEAYREYYTRFLQLGCFLPVFRSHGTDTPREIWNFGAEGDKFYDTIAKFIRLRYQLMPYVYSLAGAVRLTNATMMRALVFDYRDDPKALECEDEYLFGPSMLICPVTKAMYYHPAPTDNESEEPLSCPIENPHESRPVYLPKGNSWIDFWTGDVYEGGQTIEAYAPLDRIPIYVKAGSILPMKQGLSYADDGENQTLQIHIYSGADADFTLYEDEGNSFRYEDGEFATTALHWDEENKSFTMSERQGSYRGMNTSRQVEVYVDGNLLGSFTSDGSAHTL